MSKKMIYLISFFLVWSVVDDAQAATYVIWTDAGPDHLWSTATNWDTGALPTIADRVRIDQIPGPTIANKGAMTDRIFAGGRTNQSFELTVDGGTLTVESGIQLGKVEGTEGTLNMNGGTITVAGNIQVGRLGSTTVNMNGGTITVGDLFQIAENATATGHVNLHGGIITTKDFEMRKEAGAVGTMDVTAGTLIMEGDKLSLVQGYIDNGWITADGGAAEFLLDFGVRNSGKTTLTTTFMAVTDKAYSPSPEHNAEDVPRDVTLSWKPSEYADKHDVYFGTSFDDVNNATNLDPMGPDQIYKVRQEAINYAVPERLDFGQSYYWRVDEVNAPPTSDVVFKGDVWSFTVEPVAYPIASENVIATASSSDVGKGPENTVNNSGLDNSGLLHGNMGIDSMWLSSMAGPQPAWIEFELDKVYKLHEMWVWNFNDSLELAVGFGLKDVAIEYSVDGIEWTDLAGVPEFAQGPAAPGYAYNTTVDFGDVTAKYVKLTANSNWGGMVNQYGLSEVRFLYVPVWATDPSPVSGATDVDVNAILNWRAGREAATHDVYLGADEQAVIDGNVPVANVTEPTYAASLDLASTYYWRVDETNDVETPTYWQGDIWNLSTQEYLVVDDFESYNDIPVGEEGSNLVYGTWADGFDNPANGSTIGYNIPFQPTMESDIVHSGGQSAPLFYDNTAGATYSEAELAISPPKDWTKYGIKTLSLWFYGDLNNAADQMYVKVNDSKVVYAGDAADIKQPSWQQWNIDLTLIGVDVWNVRKLAIGFGDETNVAPNGSGVVYFDDIRLYPLREPEPNVADN